MNKKIIAFIYLFSTLLFFSSCGDNNYVPKPRGYFRIDLPEKKYQICDSSLPYQFEYPIYAKIKPYNGPQKEQYWINIAFESLKAEINISYKSVNNNLDTLLQDADALVNKHIPKANDIIAEKIIIDSTKVYGLKYEILGSYVASPYQFFLTDSVNHYLRAALYFNLIPNNDSLEPVINFIHTDILHFINTFKWKPVMKNI